MLGNSEAGYLFLIAAVKQGKPKSVGNKADNGKGCKHAKENEEVGKHKNVSLGKTAVTKGNPIRRKDE